MFWPSAAVHLLHQTLKPYYYTVTLDDTSTPSHSKQLVPDKTRSPRGGCQSPLLLRPCCRCRVHQKHQHRSLNGFVYVAGLFFFPHARTHTHTTPHHTTPRVPMIYDGRWNGGNDICGLGPCVTSRYGLNLSIYCIALHDRVNVLPCEDNGAFID